MSRPLRLALPIGAAVLAVAIAAFVGWTRLGDEPTSGSADAAETSDTDTSDTAGSDIDTSALDEVAPLDPVDLDQLGIELQIDRTRAPLADVVTQFRARADAAPGDHTTLTLLGSVLLSQAREDADLDLYSEAESVADEVLELAPTSVDGQLLHINAIAARHDFETAQAEASAILAEDPDNVAALTAVGDAQLALGDTAAALATFETIAARERTPDVISRLSRAAYLDGDTRLSADLAIEAIDAAQGVPLRPSDAAFYWFQLGFVLFEGGDVEGASTALERAIEIAPEHPGANELLGRVRAGQGRFDEAIAVYEGLLERGPAADLHGALARILRLQGDDAAADAQVRLGLELAEATLDSYPAERRHLASFLVDHDPETAVQLAETDLAERRDAGAYDMLGWALHAAGRSTEADPLMQQAIENGPQSTGFYYRAGMVAAAVGDDARAIALLEAALTINPEFDPIDAPEARATVEELRG